MPQLGHLQQLQFMCQKLSGPYPEVATRVSNTTYGSPKNQGNVERSVLLQF